MKRKVHHLTNGIIIPPFSSALLNVNPTPEEWTLVKGERQWHVATWWKSVTFLSVIFHLCRSNAKITEELGWNWVIDIIYYYRKKKKSSYKVACQKELSGLELRFPPSHAASRQKCSFGRQKVKTPFWHSWPEIQSHFWKRCFQRALS